MGLIFLYGYLVQTLHSPLTLIHFSLAGNISRCGGTRKTQATVLYVNILLTDTVVSSSDRISGEWLLLCVFWLISFRARYVT